MTVSYSLQTPEAILSHTEFTRYNVARRTHTLCHGPNLSPKPPENQVEIWHCKTAWLSHCWQSSTPSPPPLWHGFAPRLSYSTGYIRNVKLHQTISAQHPRVTERGKERGREGVKEEKTSTTSDSLALDVTFKPINYQKKTSEGRLDGWEAKWTFLSMWITYVSWLHPQLGMWQQFENATALCLPCGKTPIEKPLWILNGLLALCE